MQTNHLFKSFFSCFYFCDVFEKKLQQLIQVCLRQSYANCSWSTVLLYWFNECKFVRITSKYQLTIYWNNKLIYLFIFSFSLSSCPGLLCTSTVLSRYVPNHHCRRFENGFFSQNDLILYLFIFFAFYYYGCLCGIFLIAPAPSYAPGRLLPFVFPTEFHFLNILLIFTMWICCFHRLEISQVTNSSFFCLIKHPPITQPRHHMLVRRKTSS